MNPKTKKTILRILVVSCIAVVALCFKMCMDDQFHSKYVEVHAATINGEILRIGSNSGGVAVRLKNGSAEYWFIPKPIDENNQKSFSSVAQPGDSLLKKPYNDTIILVRAGHRMKYTYLRR